MRANLIGKLLITFDGPDGPQELFEQWNSRTQALLAVTREPVGLTHLTSQHLDHFRNSCFTVRPVLHGSPNTVSRNSTVRRRLCRKDAISSPVKATRRGPSPPPDGQFTRNDRPVKNVVRNAG